MDAFQLIDVPALLNHRVLQSLLLSTVMTMFTVPWIQKGAPIPFYGDLIGGNQNHSDLALAGEAMANGIAPNHPISDVFGIPHSVCVSPIKAQVSNIYRRPIQHSSRAWVILLMLILALFSCILWCRRMCRTSPYHPGLPITLKVTLSPTSPPPPASQDAEDRITKLEKQLSKTISEKDEAILQQQSTDKDLRIVKNKHKHEMDAVLMEKEIAVQDCENFKDEITKLNNELDRHVVAATKPRGAEDWIHTKKLLKSKVIDLEKENKDLGKQNKDLNEALDRQRVKEASELADQRIFRDIGPQMMEKRENGRQEAKVTRRITPEMKDQMYRQAAEITRYREDIIRLESDIKSKDTEIAEHRGTISILESDKKSKDAEINKNRTNINLLRNIEKSRDTEIAEHRETISILESDKKSKDAMIASKETEIISLRTGNSHLKDTIKDLTKEKSSEINDKQKNNDFEIAKLRESVANLTANEKSFTDFMNLKDAEIGSLRTSNSHLENTIKDLEERKTLELDNVQRSKDSEVAALYDIIARLEADRKSLTDSMYLKDAEIDLMRTNGGPVDAHKKRLTASRALTSANIDLLRARNRHLQKSMRYLKKDRSSVLIDAHKIQSQEAQLAEKEETLKAVLREFKEEHEKEKQELIEYHDGEVDKATRDARYTAGRQLDRLQHEKDEIIAQKDEKISDLEMEIQDMKKIQEDEMGQRTTRIRTLVEQEHQTRLQNELRQPLQHLIAVQQQLNGVTDERDKLAEEKRDFEALNVQLKFLNSELIFTKMQRDDLMKKLAEQRNEGDSPLLRKTIEILRNEAKEDQAKANEAISELKKRLEENEDALNDLRGKKDKQIKATAKRLQDQHNIQLRQAVRAQKEESEEQARIDMKTAMKRIKQLEQEKAREQSETMDVEAQDSEKQGSAMKNFGA